MLQARTIIANADIVLPGQGVHVGSVLIADGRIAQISEDDIAVDGSFDRINAAGLTLTPGLIDVHIHGIGQSVFEAGPQELIEGSRLLPQFGATCVLPTLYNVMQPTMLGKVERLADALSAVPGASMPGFHLEGPFLALGGAGASTMPGDVKFLDELLAAAKGRVLAMSVSPETKNIIPVIERLREHEIAVFLTHTGAAVDESVAAIEVGARHATHFYDVFPAPPELDAGVRPVGAVETILADSRCTVDFICDGVHVHPMAIRAALAAKGWQGVIAITDANVGAGLSDGIYSTTWGYSVRVKRGDGTRIADRDHKLCGALAGSSLTLDQAITNLRRWLPLRDEQVWAMATVNPARCVGLADKGRMEVGADADLVLWDCTEVGYRAIRTWIAGNTVYEAQTQVAGS